ncbi:MAG: hypothetical protein KC478_04460 [Bacteriovoracaceae bacterium]|nr:hypothetical protein [Bacteriovoracaceae bacterium]
MSKGNKENYLHPLEMKMKVKAISAPRLLFFEFDCPHCERKNVMAKAMTSEYVLCSSSSCRRLIHIENFDDVA